MPKRPLHGVSRRPHPRQESLLEALLTAALAITTVAIIAAIALFLIPEAH